MLPLAQIWIVFTCLVFAYAADYRPQGDSVYGFPKNKPTYAFGTYVPIQTYSFNASLIYLDPLKVYIDKKSELIAQNIGYTVYFTPKGNNANYVTGGPFFNVKYKLGLIAQNNDYVKYDTRVSTTEDGKGFPCQIQVFYVNENYKTFNDALKYRDGLAIFLFNIVVDGVVDNQLFYPYEKVLQEVIYPNATAPINTYDALYWLFAFLTKDYYTYPGAFIDITNRKQYFCATMVESNFFEHAWVSGPQYDQSFLRVLNQNYQLQANPLGLYPTFGRPFCQVNGTVDKYYVNGVSGYQYQQPGYQYQQFGNQYLQ